MRGVVQNGPLLCPAERCETFPTHFVISSVARNLLFDNWRPLADARGDEKRER
jgi:hypothetical protein